MTSLSFECPTVLKLILEYYRYSRSIAAVMHLPSRHNSLPRKAGISDLSKKPEKRVGGSTSTVTEQASRRKGTPPCLPLKLEKRHDELSAPPFLLGDNEIRSRRDCRATQNE
jgi:hypothetical protein